MPVAVLLVWVKEWMKNKVYREKAQEKEWSIWSWVGLGSHELS